MTAQRIIVFLGIVLSVLTAGLGSAWADSAGKIETSYEVNVRGITVLDIKYTSETSAAGYSSQASIETRGVAAIFSDYRMKMAASGALVDGRTSPAQYKSRSEKKDKTKALEVNWSQGAVSASETIKNPETKAEVDAAVLAGVTDPLTAIFRIGTLPSGRPCQAVHRIFDGKEVFELRFSFKGEAMLDDSFPGAYHGKAFECRATYVPVAGRYATKFRKSKRRPADIQRLACAPLAKAWRENRG